MKKTLNLLVLATSLFVIVNSANAQAFEQGKSYVSVSYGFGSYYNVFSKAIADLYPDVKYKSFGPIYGKYEYAVSEHIGLGLNVAYLSTSFNYNETYSDGTDQTTYKWKLDRSTYSVLARMNVHFGDHDKLDPYWGFGIGYRGVNWKNSYSVVSTDSSSNISPQAYSAPVGFPIGFETTFGIRYLFHPNLGAFAEVGFAKSFAQVGITGKF